MKLFQYAVIFNPVTTKEQRDRGEEAKSELIVEPTSILARDEKEVAMLVARAIPEKYVGQLNHVEIAIRPF